MHRLMIIETTSATPPGTGAEGRVAWRQQPQLILHGHFADPNETGYRIGAPIEVRRGDRTLLSSRIMSVLFCSRLGTPPQQGHLELPDFPTEPFQPGDEVWIGERTQAELHRAVVDWSVPSCRQPVNDASLDRLEAELHTHLPHAYRRFMKRFGAGEYNVMPLDDRSWYCDPEAHGDAPLIFLLPERAIEATFAYWSHGMPHDMIVLFNFGGCGWGTHFLIGMPHARDRGDDLPLISFEWPYLYPTWARPYAASFDGLLAGVLDASFAEPVPFTYDRSRYYTGLNRLELGREVVANLGPDSRMFRYWIELPPGRRFRVELRCDEPTFTVWLHVRPPNCKPTLVSSFDKKGWQGNRDALVFDTQEGGFFDMDGGAFHGTFQDKQPPCVVRLKVAEDDAPNAD